MKLTRIPALVLIGGILVLAGCKQDSVAEKYRPATLDSTEVKGIMKVTLDAKAAERIGMETVELAEEDGRKVLPYGALMYDTMGNTWTFTNPSPLVFVRAQVKVAVLTSVASFEFQVSSGWSRGRLRSPVSVDRGQRAAPTGDSKCGDERTP